MKKSLLILIVLLGASFHVGCILFKAPSGNTFNMAPGDQLTYSVSVFPPAAYTWVLDGEVLSNTKGKYVYTASAGTHELTVTAEHFLGIDSQTWNIVVLNLPGPIIELLNSLVTIPAGSFMMGNAYEDPYCEVCSTEETTPVHQVTLQSFDIGRYEVTQAQYQAVTGTNPSYFQGLSYPDWAKRPVEQVSYNDAKAFCQQLSSMTGRTVTLPSEAQWEYACRAGTTTLYSWGKSDSLIDDYAWWSNNSGNETHPVGTKLPNPWGLYDMHGNVFEWCLDSYHYNYTGAPADGSAWETDASYERMGRGGSFNAPISWIMNSAFRSHSEPARSYSSLGFRVLAVR